MYVHNFYSDLMLSTRILFDNAIFKNADYIKRYEFNYGNRTFQLDKEYKTEFEFPVAIVSLSNQSVPFGQRTENLQMTRIENINHVPVLLNKTNGKVLYMQEEHSSVNLSISINCESQFQAKEMEHVILRYLPLNKYCSIIKYTSFLELDQQFENYDEFNCNEHDIINLYTKMNKNLGQIDHCFSLWYEPLIKNESTSVSISDSSQRSFQVSIELNYLIQIPVKLFSDDNKYIDSVNINYTPNTFEPVFDYPVQKILNENSNKQLHNNTVKRQFILSEELVSFNEQQDKYYVTIQFDHGDMIIDNKLSFAFLFKGHLYKELKYELIEPTNKIIFEFSKTYWETEYKDFNVVNPILVQFIKKDKVDGEY